MIVGTVAPGYEPVRAEIEAVLARRRPDLGPYSAQLAAFVHGRPVVDLVIGDGLGADAVTGVFSVTKGIAATVIGLLVRQNLLSPDRRVAHYWPEFAAQGKVDVLVRELLSHQAGLVGIAGGISTADLADSGEAASQLAAARPAWQPGAMFGYHGLTLGILMEELVRRVTGERLQDVFEREIRAPRALDFYLGLPAELEHRFLPVEAPVTTGAAVPTAGGVEMPADGLDDVMFNERERGEGIVRGVASPNLVAIRANGPASVGGVGSARGIAQTYAATIGAFAGRPSLLDPLTVEVMSQEQVSGRDRLLGVDMRFGVVFMKSQSRMAFGSHLAFGHDGAGGALGFADPAYGLGFGYIPHPMQPPGGADPKGVRLAQAVRACAARLVE